MLKNNLNSLNINTPPFCQNFACGTLFEIRIHIKNNFQIKL